MKTWPDKTELRIHRSAYGPLEWSLAPPKPGTAATFRRWNVVLIAILVFLVLGVFVTAEAPRTASTTPSLKENQSPLSVQHANSNKSTPPAIPGRSRSGNLSKDALSARRAG